MRVIRANHPPEDGSRSRHKANILPPRSRRRNAVFQNPYYLSRRFAGRHHRQRDPRRENWIQKTRRISNQKISFPRERLARIRKIRHRLILLRPPPPLHPLTPHRAPPHPPLHHPIPRPIPPL